MTNAIYLPAPTLISTMSFLAYLLAIEMNEILWFYQIHCVHPASFAKITDDPNNACMD